jgi:hypothetical protein
LKNNQQELQLPTNITDPIFETRLMQLADQMQTAEDQLEAILSMTRHQLEKGYFPITLFPYESWILEWYGIRDAASVSEEEEDKVRMAKQFISQLPLTTVKRKTGCDSYNRLSTVVQDCILDMLTIVPNVRNLKEFVKIEFTPHPVPVNSNNKNTKWRKIRLPAGIDVYQNNGSYYSLDHQLQCFSSIPNENCQLCSSSHAFEKITDKCLIQVLQDAATTPPCESNFVDEHESMQHIRDRAPRSGNQSTVVHDLVITNNKPTMIIEACPAKESSYELPLAVRVQIGASCTFKLINAPALHTLIPGLNYSTIKDFNFTGLPRIVDMVTTNAENIKEHFDVNAHIYIIVLASVTLVNLVACASFIICRKSCMPARHYVHTRTSPNRTEASRHKTHLTCIHLYLQSTLSSR